MEATANLINMRKIEGFPGYLITENGEVWSEKRKAFRKLTKTKTGYLMVAFRTQGKFVNKSVHRLVAKAYIPNPENKPIVNHLDGCKTNNCVDNLEWVSAADNVAHAWRNGLCTVSDKLREVARETAKRRFSKKVSCLETGLTFFSATEASRFLGKSDHAVKASIRSGCKCGGYTWEYIDE